MQLRLKMKILGHSESGKESKNKLIRIDIVINRLNKPIPHFRFSTVLH